MIGLMNTSITNERFILVAENLTFKNFLTQLAIALSVTPPKKEASNSLLQIAWRLDWLRYQFKKTYRKITKETVKSLMSDSQYDITKVQKALPDFKYTPIKTSIKTTAQLFLKDL